MNWYYADYDGGHSTKEEQFESDDKAIAHYLKMPTCNGGIETIYNCGVDNQSETVIWDSALDKATFPTRKPPPACLDCSSTSWWPRSPWTRRA